MEEGISCKPVEVSDEFKASRRQIFDYSFETFGHRQTERYIEKIDKSLNALSECYLLHSECRHLATKSRKYRNIMLDAHLIIYRVTTERIEVLDIVHSKSSITKIRNVRKIRL